MSNFDHVFKAYQFETRKEADQAREFTARATDYIIRFGYPELVLFGNRAHEPLIRQTFPDAELQFGTNYFDQFWLGKKDDGTSVVVSRKTIDRMGLGDLVEDTPGAKYRRKRRQADDNPPSRFADPGFWNKSTSGSIVDDVPSYVDELGSEYGMDSRYNSGSQKGAYQPSLSMSKPSKPVKPKPLGSGEDHAALEAEVAAMLGTPIEPVTDDPDDTVPF